MPPPSVLVALKEIRYERGDRSPFRDHSDFLRWTDKAEPLLGFNDSLLAEFRDSVRAAKLVIGWKQDKYDGAVNSAIGAVNRAITILEHEEPPATAPAIVEAEAEAPKAVEPKVTLKWMFEHATWPVYATLLGAVAVAFGFGREVGKLETQIQSNSFSKPAPMTTTPTSTTNSSKEPTKLDVKSHIASAPK